MKPALSASLPVYMKKSYPKFSVLLPEGDSNLLPFVVNCLSRKRGVNIYVISNNPKAEVRKSNKIKNFSSYPKAKSEEEWVANLNTEMKRFKIDIILPFDEFGIQAAIKFKNQILQNEKLVFLPSLEHFLLSNNKGALAQHMKEHGVSAPSTFLFEKYEICKKSPIDFPIILKPLEGYGGGRGIHKFEDNDSMQSFYSSNTVEVPYLIQSYIEGYDIDCSVLCKNGEILAYTIQKGFLAGTEKFGPNVGVEFLYRDDMLNVVKRLMKSLNWNGVAHIDMRYDKSDGSYKVVEINPRFWETTEASEIAGINFPFLYCLSFLGVEFNQPKFQQTKFLNLIGLSKSIKKNKWFVFNLKFILGNTPLKYYLTDPKPMLSIVFNKLKSVFR
ncbi:ATP-grasp domain-containing protein [Tamlana crocina]